MICRFSHEIINYARPTKTHQEKHPRRLAISYFMFNNRDFAVKLMTRVFFQFYRSDAWTVVLVGLLFLFSWDCSCKKIESLKK